jgi:nitrite reductase (NADH) small subunit/3-phenylpropionate/trans-cinnamate dioxygenase ferredoxin subunit
MPTTVAVAKLSEVPPGTAVGRVVDGRPLAVCNDGGRVFVLLDQCPHAGAALSGGEVGGGLIECPWHGWRFRLADGQWADAPRGKVRVPCFPVTVVGDQIVVEIEDGPVTAPPGC